MSKPTASPHDAVFKAFLTHPETARDFLHISRQLKTRSGDNYNA